MQFHSTAQRNYSNNWKEGKKIRNFHWNHTELHQLCLCPFQLNLYAKHWEGTKSQNYKANEDSIILPSKAGCNIFYEYNSLLRSCCFSKTEIAIGDVWILQRYSWQREQKTNQVARWSVILLFLMGKSWICMYLVDWTKKCKMKFEVDKHKAMYMGEKKTHNNPTIA